jgi:hypothetical protein
MQCDSFKKNEQLPDDGIVRPKDIATECDGTLK